MNLQSMRTMLALIGLVLIFSIPGVANAGTDMKVNGTTGTPLGGFGAGGVKFNGNEGTFAIMTRPPADAYDFKKVEGAAFQFFAKRGEAAEYVDQMKTVLIDGRPDDDAIWPLHRVNFGTINDVKVEMTGFSPLDNEDYDNMSLPYAFYELTLTNTKSSDAKVAIALQWNSEGEPFQFVAGKGISNSTRTVFASAKGKNVSITGGNAADTGFLKNGVCNNAVDQNLAKVAVSLDLKANETRVVKFVVSWYETVDPELAYYFNLYDNSEAIADYGLQQFDRLKANAENLVNRFRASNLPDWLKNQTLNTLANLTTNSMYKKDGRVAFAEGQWTCFGTMDQMWHARQIVSQLVPFYAWQELRYWARTQMTNGQIHHDFNLMGDASEKEKRSALVGWDDTEHQDYRNIQKWVDLNCAMIISTYETYRITGDKKEFDFLWPYLKKAARRILDQVEEYGSEDYPYTFDDSENSYDAGGDPNPFNASLSAVAYKAMVLLAGEKQDPDIANRYQEAYDQVVQSFEARYLNDNGFPLGKHCEGYFTGQWLALHLNLGEVWSQEKTDWVLSKLDSYYHPYYWGLGNEEGTYDEWTPYILTHYAGLLLNTKRVAQWQAMQEDAYNRQYLDRNGVFNHPLNILPVVESPKWIATRFSSDRQYISLPGIWRNYYDIMGYSHNAATNELWLKPRLPQELNHTMTGALVITPEGYGTIDCTASGTNSQNKQIRYTPDYTVAVSTLYLEDNFGEKVEVNINGKNYAFERVGSGYAKELAIQFDGKITPKGILVEVTGDAGAALPALPEKPEVANENTEVQATVSAYSTIEAESASTTAGVKTVELTNGGAYVGSCNNFDYIQFANVDFGDKGATQFWVKTASPEKGATIEIMIDNVAGDIIGNCEIPFTGSFDQWETVSCPVNKIVGVHDLILRFSGASAEDLMGVDKFIFGTTDDKIETPFD